jgi:hypothetical protein
MGILIAGLAFLAGLFLADRIQDHDAGVAADARRALATRGMARVGAIAVSTAAAPKCQAGQIVAVLPHACWGEVVAVAVGADGLPRYEVALRSGRTVEVLGREIA